MKVISKLFNLLLILVVLSTFELQAQTDNNFEISKNLDIYSSVLKELNKNYADQINPGQLTQDALDAMLESLDPYTVYIPESRAEDYKLMTTGQYGGIGALIHQNGDYVIISEPYEGFPAQKAGLKAGDKILEINGTSMKGKTTEEVSNILKGQPGGEIDMLIERDGEAQPIDKKIVREEIKIPNIPYYGMVNDHIGYIKLLSFTQNAGNEVKKAFLDLKDNHDLKGIILDLRGNGGGLLNEAVNITNVWVDKGQLIVSTKGKSGSKDQDHFTRYPAVDPDIPLAVLVDRGSASASEIVTGSIQDLDRGVIIGQRTFGKGLVQNIVPLPYNAQIKITVAKYYIPSGRCIQAIDYFHRDANGDPEKVPDSLITEFKTKIGRPVFDGGGIEPDIVMKPENFSKIAQILVTKFLLFDFATKYAEEHKTIPPPDKFNISDEDYNELIAFLKDKSYDYKTNSEEALEKLKQSAEKEKYFDSIKSDFTDLKDKMMHDKSEDLITYKDQIKELLKDEIVSRYYYQTGRIIASLNNDPELNKAINVLEGRETYLAILDGTLKPSSDIKSDKVSE